MKERMCTTSSGKEEMSLLLWLQLHYCICIRSIRCLWLPVISSRNFVWLLFESDDNSRVAFSKLGDGRWRNPLPQEGGVAAEWHKRIIIVQKLTSVVELWALLSPRCRHRSSARSNCHRQCSSQERPTKIVSTS